MEVSRTHAIMVIFIHHNNGSSKKKNTKYELNINLNYHIGSHITTKLLSIIHLSIIFLEYRNFGKYG